MHNVTLESSQQQEFTLKISKFFANNIKIISILNFINRLVIFLCIFIFIKLLLKRRETLDKGS